MSRGQEKQVVDQAKSQGETQFGDSQNSYTQAQADVGDYKSQLGKYAASNPYTPGGEFQTSTNRVLANAADANATAAGAQVQQQARRTGQNSQGANATAEEIARASQRNLSAEQGGANATRIGAEADYNKGVLGATAVPVSMETQLAEGSGRMAQGDLGIQQDASKTPGFWDTMGDSFAQQFGKTMGGGGLQMPGMEG
jgi:hypothetical protein